MFAYGMLPLMTSTNEVRSGKMYRFAVYVYAIRKEYFTSIINDSKQLNLANEERNLPFRAHKVSFDCYAMRSRNDPCRFYFSSLLWVREPNGMERNEEKQNNERNYQRSH